MATPYFGMRGTGDWGTDERPKNFREGILRLYPNGSMPLTAIMSKMGSEKTDDPEFAWWEKILPTQEFAVTGVYTDAGLSSAYTSGAVAGSVLYLKMAAASVGEIRERHQLLLRDASNLTVDVNAKVTMRVVNGASSFVAVKLLEADDNGVGNDLSDCDTVLINGNVNSEGAEIGDSIAYDPTKIYNYTQIWRTPLEITRTARKTRLRTADAYKEAKREALELHGIEMEKSFIHGQRYEGTGDNGKPERTTMGIVNYIKTYASGNVFNYTTDTDYSGQTWLQGGEDWLNAKLEVLFRYGSDTRLGICGSGFLLGIQRLAKTGGQIFLEAGDIGYGIKVVRWITPFGEIMLKTHPLFSFTATDRNRCVLIQPEELKYRYIDDTFFKTDESEKKAGQIGRDGTKEEYLTEAGLEMHFAVKHGILDGGNLDNSL